MSKTVKRAMRVMMIGLVALLGANAEAHYVYVAGKYKYCSVCNEAKLTAENDSISPDHTEQLEFILTTISTDETVPPLEILCPNGTIVPSWEQFTLAVQRTIGEGDITNGEGGPLTIAEVQACVSDGALLVSSLFCDGDPPTDVLIRKMKAESKTSWCPVSNLLPCVPVSTSVADCTLPGKFNLKKYPNNLPRGALYKCE